VIDETTLKLLFHHVDTPALAVRAARDLLRQVNLFASSESDDEREKGVHPSTLARCVRQAAMELEGIPRTNTQIPDAVRRAAEMGKALHARIQDDFIRSAKNSKLFTFEKEVPLDPKHQDVMRYELRGKSDGLLVYRGERMGLEIKGLGVDVYALVHQSTLLPGSVIPESHLLQASVYQHCLDFKAMWFLYVKRETLLSTPFVVRIPDQYWQAMRRRAMLVLEMALKDLMPPGTSNAYDCTMCAYRPTCPQPINTAVPKAKVWECVQRLRDTDQT
jgi:hypothetical protein